MTGIHFLQSKLNRLKLLHKIIALTIVCILFSTGVLGFFANIVATRTIEFNAYKHTNETIRQSQKYINEKLLNTLNNLHNLFTTESFRNAIIAIATDSQANVAGEFSRMQRALSQARISDRLIDSIYVYTPKVIFYDTTEPALNREKLLESRLFRAIRQHKVIEWGLNSEVKWLPKRGLIPVALTTGIQDVSPEKAFVIVHLKEDQLIEYLSEIRNQFAAETYLLDRSGRMVTHSYDSGYRRVFRDKQFAANLHQQDSNYFRYRINGRKVLVNYASLPVNGWQIVTITPERQLLLDIENITWLTILVGIGCAGLAILLSIIVTKTITKPLYKLQNVMKRIQNRDFEARFEPKYDDEIGELAKHFNSMVEEINSLIVRLNEEHDKYRQEQKLKQIAELNALQSQINPHFLYNALDSIYWKALAGGNDQVAEMVIALAQIFRLGLNKGKEEVAIDQEIQHVANYLSLQKSIYEGKFDYQIEVEPGIGAYKTQKFILQPLAENALLHGFSEMGCGGMIRIKVWQSDGRICFEITDNGKGFDVQALEQYLTRVPGGEKGGYALSNIHQRLQLRWGDEYRLELSSEAYRETTVRIRIPLLEEDVHV